MPQDGILNEIEPIPWRGFSATEKLIVVILPILALTAAVLPFLDEVFLRRLARITGLRPLISWMINDFGSWIISLGLVLLLVIFLLFKRRRLMNDMRLWSGFGCPNCQERELVRVSRKKRDRLYALVEIPVYRYACRNCTWRGKRIARRIHSPEMDLALEEALLRFDPDDYKSRRLREKSFEATQAITESSKEMD
jgi:hypothetical protein